MLGTRESNQQFSCNLSATKDLFEANFTLFFPSFWQNKAGVGPSTLFTAGRRRSRRLPFLFFRKILRHVPRASSENSETRTIVSSEDVTQRHFYSRLLISVGETGRPSRRSTQQERHLLPHFYAASETMQVSITRRKIAAVDPWNKHNGTVMKEKEKNKRDEESSVKTRHSSFMERSAQCYRCNDTLNFRLPERPIQLNIV